MPLFILQGCGFSLGLATSVYAGYYYLLDPALQSRYKNLSLLAEIERQMFVDESKMTAELNELERSTKRVADQYAAETAALQPKK